MVQNKIMRGFIAGLAFALAFILVACQKEASNPLSSQAATDHIGQTALGKGSVVQRPLSDFLNSQTSTFFWFDSDNPQYAIVSDYAGQIANAAGLSLGSTYTGTITEQALDDGTAKVVVDVKGSNVLTWTRLLNAPFSVVFGATAGQVAGGATPALGTVHLRWEFINSAPGAPIPSNIGYAGTKRIDLQAQAFGALTAASGLGPDGTPGRTWTTQVGLLAIPPHTNTPLDDRYPAEFVKIAKVGN